MRPFTERNPLTVGVLGLALTGVAVTAALNYKSLPFIHPEHRYSAYFAEAGGIAAGAAVQVSGFQVGSVSDVSLYGDKVLVEFKVSDDVRLGDRTEAAVKTKSLLGARILEVIPRGSGELDAPIPLDRTTPPYQLTDALSDLATTVDGLNTGQLSQSLSTLAQTFSTTPPALQAAVHGLARFSESLNARDAQLRNFLANARKVSQALSERTDQVVSLISDTNALLAALRTESNAVDSISANISALSQQLSGLVAENRQQLRPSIDKLNGVLTIVANRKERLQDAVKRLNSFAMSLGEAVSSGPFFNAYLANLLPGQFIQPFIDAAFSDLGLDPNVKLPSELTDPQTGQAATPALPLPFPRTGQGGEPKQTLPDAITGNPDDPRYPYREPPPAPAPGGPPPGPPLPGAEPEPTPSAVYQPAPGEPPSTGSTTP